MEVRGPLDTEAPEVWAGALWVGRELWLVGPVQTGQRPPQMPA